MENRESLSDIPNRIAPVVPAQRPPENRIGFHPHAPARLGSLLVLAFLLACGWTSICAAEVSLAWNPSPDSSAIGYRVYWGNQSRQYAQNLTVGNITNATVSTLADGRTYFLAVTAYDGNNLESDFSNEVEYTTPGGTANSPPTISDISSRTLNEDASTGAIAFTVADPDTALTSLNLTGTSSNPILVPTPNIVFGGSAGSRTVTVTPAANQSGTATITVTVSDGSSGTSDSFALTVNAVNDAPTLSDITNRTINEDVSTGAIAFTVADPDTALTSLTLIRASSNPTVVPTANIVLGGSAGSRTVTVIPAANQSGTVTITVTVSDGSLTASDTFVLTVLAVNDAPTISNISNRTLNEDASTGAVAFTVADPDTALTSLTLARTSSNPTLVPTANIVFGGSAGSRTVTVTPAANCSGTATITVTVSDGSLTANDTFVLTVNPVNDAPTISNISNRTIHEDASTGTIAFTVADPDTALTSLTLARASSNPTLVPTANIVFSGSAGNRTVIVTPATNQSGTATITVTVSDGSLSASDTFLVTINAVNDAPTISDITNRTINKNASTGAISFTVADPDTALTSLTLARVSSNPTLVPTANIVFSGSAGNRTVIVTPATNQSGTATITVTVSDGALSASDSFLLTINGVTAPPTLSDIANRVINEDASTSAIAFVVADPDTALTSLTLARASSNPTLVPTANIVFGGSAGSRTVTVTPAANQSGTATITVTVSDGSLSASDTFVLTVNAVNDAPTLGDCSDCTINEDASTGAIAFTVADPDSALTSLTLAGASSNPTLVPNANIVFGGSAGSRTVTVTPAANQSGTATLTLTVSDGSSIASDTFVLTVEPRLPLPWLAADVGSPALAGDAIASGGTFTVGGAGVKVGGYSDQFHYVYQTMTGDGEIVARLASIEPTHAAAKVGVMLRAELTGASKHYFVCVTPTAFLNQKRNSTGGNTTTTTVGSLYSTPNNWVRITRATNTFQAYLSPDGATWTLVNSHTFALPTTIYMGLAVSSNDATKLNTSNLDNVTVVP